MILGLTIYLTIGMAITFVCWLLDGRPNLIRIYPWWHVGLLFLLYPVIASLCIIQLIKGARR